MTVDTGAVVVGIDGSTAAMGAAKWAAAVAQRFGAPLELINGMPGEGRLLTDAARAIRAAAFVEHRDHATVTLASTEEELRAAFPGLGICTLQSDEPVDELLISRSRTARLVVLGSEMVSPAAALLIGSTTLAVTAHSACPVVTWRESSGAPTEDRPVVLGVDSPNTGSAAFRSAFEFAQAFGVGLEAVHAWSPLRPPLGAMEPYLIDWDGLEALQWQELVNVLDPWTKRYPDVEVTYFVEPEGPSKALLRHATESQLVVVGSRGRSLLAGAVLGSTGLNMLHHCSAPVMLCHKSTDET